jgi:metal-sulfur cluster biosynthetic enzyme
MKLSGMKTIRDKIVKQLQEVYDPEISINVFDLGLIYDIQINEEERSVEITHTLTSAFCGFADVIAEDIKNAGYVPGIDNVSIVTTFDPPFNMDMVPEETKLILGWL